MLQVKCNPFSCFISFQLFFLCLFSHFIHSELCHAHLVKCFPSFFLVLYWFGSFFLSWIYFFPFSSYFFFLLFLGTVSVSTILTDCSGGGKNLSILGNFNAFSDELAFHDNFMRLWSHDKLTGCLTILIESPAFSMEECHA